MFVQGFTMLTIQNLCSKVYIAVFRCVYRSLGRGNEYAEELMPLLFYNQFLCLKTFIHVLCVVAAKEYYPVLH